MEQYYQSILARQGFTSNKYPARLWEFSRYEPARNRRDAKHFTTWISIGFGHVQTDLMNVAKYDRRFKYILVFLELLSRRIFLVPVRTKSLLAWERGIKEAVAFFGGNIIICFVKHVLVHITTNLAFYNLYFPLSFRGLCDKFRSGISFN